MVGIFLCLSFHVRVHQGKPEICVRPSPPCGDSPKGGGEDTPGHNYKKPCKPIPLSVAAPTIAASLDCRYLSGLKDERENAAKVLEEAGLKEDIGSASRGVDKKRLIDDVRQALYASKICSYAQGMNLLRAKSLEKGWDLNLGEMARIWKGGCIIRAVFLDRIKKAYQRNPNLASLVVDPDFAKEMVQRQAAWRRVVGLAISAGISTPGMCASLAYFDTYRRARLPANLVQAQRDLFGAHTYERTDRPGAYHTEWTKLARKSQ